MNVKEKILLIQLLLEDIRGNWGWENTGGVCSRAIKAEELCEELAYELKDNRYFTLANSCSGYIAHYYDDGDGRWFREQFPHGYENMDNLHGLNPTYMDKSDEFKEVAEEYLTHPEYRFDDWKERFND